MDKKVLDWLLEGPPWLRYAVKLQLLDNRPDITPVQQDSAIQEIISRLKGSITGIPALKTGKVHYTETGKAYWNLFFLADIGLTVDDAGLGGEAEEIAEAATGDEEPDEAEESAPKDAIDTESDSAI